MHLSWIVVLSLVVCVCQVLGQANTYEYSDQKPWSLLYTLYPFYNSETLLEVWREDETADISTNIVTTSPHEQGQTLAYNDGVRRNDTSSKLQDDLSYFSSEMKNVNKENISKNRQRFSNYRNMHKDISLQSEQ